MLSNIGITELLLIAVVVLLLFGPSKLPEMGRSLGNMIQEFRKASKGILEDESEPSSSKSQSQNDLKTVNQETRQEKSHLPD
jgi:sec-independent protein translocase protein TatA